MDLALLLAERIHDTYKLVCLDLHRGEGTLQALLVFVAPLILLHSLPCNLIHLLPCSTQFNT